MSTERRERGGKAMEFRSERERYLGTENRANQALNIIAMKWKIVSTLEEIEGGMGEKKNGTSSVLGSARSAPGTGRTRGAQPKTER